MEDEKRNHSHPLQEWTTVDENGVVTIPEEILGLLGWEIGDELHWIEDGNGEFLLVKIKES